MKPLGDLINTLYLIELDKRLSEGLEKISEELEKTVQLRESRTYPGVHLSVFDWRYSEKEYINVSYIQTWSPDRETVKF